VIYILLQDKFLSSTLIFCIMPLSVGLWVDVGNMESKKKIQHNREDDYTYVYQARW
jgi:hypothetical protein